MFRLNKKRPTLADAHKFHRDGSYTVDEYVSNETVMSLAYDISDTLTHVSSKNIPRTKNLEYLVLKCHVVTEFAITQFIRFSSRPVISVDQIRFTFSQKIDIAYMMGLGHADPCMIPSLELLNKARNQVAHKLEFDLSVVDELIRINSDYYEGAPKMENKDRLRAIRIITRFFCAQVAGNIVANAQMERLTDLRHRK